MSYIGKNYRDHLMSDFTIEGSGASGILVSDFNTVRESCGRNGQPKYPASPVIAWLAKVVIGYGGGANKDTPLYELCNLIYALNSLHENGKISDGRMEFFLGSEQATANTYKSYFVSGLSNDNSSQGQVQIKETGIDIYYEGGEFTISYKRMAFLSSLFEFLLTMDGFSHYETFNDLFDTLTPLNTESNSDELRLIQDTSNKISSILRIYRRKNLPRAQHDAKFDKLFRFIQQRSSENQITIDDAAVLEFWQSHSFLEEYRIYKTVFDSFIILLKSLDEAALQKTIGESSHLGTDIENEEVDPDDRITSITDFSEWQSPFTILDIEPIKNIKFFKQKNERQPIEQLMHYGPYAYKLPLAFIRTEAFGIIQNGISNDLRLSKSPKQIADRMKCETAQNYLKITDNYQMILDHINQLQLATLHVLGQSLSGDVKTNTDNGEDNIITLFDQTPLSKFEQARGSQSPMDLNKEKLRNAIEASHQAFKSFTRSGFTEEFSSKPDNVDAFRLAAGALVQMENILKNFLDTPIISEFRRAMTLDQFNKDKKLFSEQFRTIYGAAE